MKLVIAALLLLASNARAAYTLMGSTKASNTSTNSAVTSAVDTTGADLLVVIGLGFSVNACIVTGGAVAQSDSKSNTWTAVANYANGNANVCGFYAINPIVGTAHVFTLQTGTGGSYPTAFVSWWSGSQSVATKDQHNGAGSATGTTIQPGSITPTQDNELIIAGIADGAAVNTRTIDSGFTKQDDQNSNSFSTGAWAYLVQTTAAAVNPTWTNGNSGLGRGTTIISFKAAGGMGGTPATPRKRTVAQ